MNRSIAGFLTVILILGQLVTLGIFAAGATGYPDVKESRWSYADVAYVSEKGLMNGVDGGKFDPAGKITRGMVVTVLYRYEGSPVTLYSSMFSDVKEGKWFTDAVLWAGRNDIVNGVGGGKFAPNDNVTREQLAAIIYRFADYKKIDTDKKSDITGYEDYKKIHDYAREALAWTNEAGLIKGVTDTTLNPRGTATREQFAAIIHRFDTLDLPLRFAYNLPTAHSYYTEKEYPLADDADFFVAVDGDDGAAGTKDAPFRTFARAVEAVNELKKDHKGEIKVAFMAGNYGEMNINLGYEDAGTAETPITYQAYGDGEVIFDNGATFTKESFTKISEEDKKYFDEKAVGNIYKTDVRKVIDPALIPDSAVVFCGDSIMFPARYPNASDEGDDVYTSAGMPSSDDRHMEVISYIAKRIAAYHTVSGMKISGYLKYDWWSEVAKVQSYDAASKTVEFTKDTDYGIGDGPRFFISDVSEELDAPGEYWIDRESGTLYAYEPTGDISICIGGEFINAQSSYLTFRGFTFINSSFRPVLIIGDHLNLDKCTIKNADGCLRVGGRDIHITENEFCNLTGLCIYVVGYETDKEFMLDSGILIDNNLFHDFAKVDKTYSPAVNLDGGISGVVISHNEIYNTAHAALTYDGVNTRIEYNVIHDVVTGSEDMGATYSGKSLTNCGTLIRYNLFYNIGGDLGPFCVYLDDGLAGQEVYGNIFYGNSQSASVTMGGGRENKIHDNVTVIPKKTNGRGLMLIDKYRTMAEEGEMSGTYTGLIDSYAPYTYTSELWIERYPWLSRLDLDPTHYEDIECLVNPSYCVVKNNYTIGSGAYNEIPDTVVEYGEVENNLFFTTDENPLFVDPTHGDYNIRDDVDFMKIPFSEIGRY